MIRSVADFYSYLFQEEGEVTTAFFQTKTGTEYRVYFYPAMEYFDGLSEDSFIYKDGYFFGFTKLAPNENKIEPIDIRVRNTIVNVVNEFFNEKGIDKVLIFHCDDSDGKNCKRALCFNEWYYLCETTNCFEKRDEEIKVPDEETGEYYTHYTSIIIECNNPYIDAITAEFQIIKEQFISNK